MTQRTSPEPVSSKVRIEGVLERSILLKPEIKTRVMLGLDHCSALLCRGPHHVVTETVLCEVCLVSHNCNCVAFGINSNRNLTSGIITEEDVMQCF